jgi:hypothetical protein
MSLQLQQKQDFFDSGFSPILKDEHLEDFIPSATSSYMQVLGTYTSYGLSDLKNANLMDRVDTKFLISMQHLALLLSELQPYYSALEIDGTRLFTYHNTYFDTAGHSFYNSHHQGKLGRYKVRHRYYVDNQLGFLEVKFKNNKGRTIKSRIKQGTPCLDSQEVTSFLTAKLQGNFHDLQPTQLGAYQRISLADEASGERLTLDLNLNFQSVDKGVETGASVHLDKLFVAELKQSRHSMDSPFVRLMSRWGIRPNSFSKYCIGCSMVTPGLKANRFKPQLMAVKKIN